MQVRIKRTKTYEFNATADARLLRLISMYELQAIAKRVDTLPVIGYILDTHHCIACSPPPLPPHQCCMKFAMTFNQASINIERGRGGLEGYNTVCWPFIVCYLQEIG